MIYEGKITSKGQTTIPKEIRQKLNLKAGDKISVKNRPHSIAPVKLNQQSHMEPIPDFLEIVGAEPPEGRLIRIPSKGDADPRLSKDKELNEQLIIEFCSR